MADGVAITAGAGTTVLTDDTGAGGHAQIVKLAISTDGSGTLIPATAANGITTDVTRLPALPAGTNNIGDVDVASSVLPTGAATVAEQQTQTTSLQLLDDAVATVGSAAVAKGNQVTGTDGTNARVLKTDAAGELQVDVLTVPTVTINAIPAGTNNIGDVDVLSLPALPAGANNIGDVDVLTLPALPAGTNNIGDVDVLSVVPGTGATALGKAEDAAHTTGDVGVLALGVRRDADTSPVDVDGDYHAPIFDALGNLKVNIKAGAGSGGTAQVDQAAFTAGTTSGTPIQGYRDDTAPSTLTEGQVGVIRATTNRALHVNLRDAAGAELAVGGGTQYDEDTAHVTADKLTLAGAVRRDAAASGVDADGDRATLNVNSVGRLYATATVDAALPAGTNNIGDVDVLSLPALPAGTNNIGDVDVLSSALPTGASTLAEQQTQTTALQLIDDVIATDGAAVLTKGAQIAGTDGTNAQIVKTDTAGELQVDVLTLPTVTINAIPAGTNNIGDVDVLSLPALPAGANNIGDVDVLTLPALPAGTNNIGDVDIASLPNEGQQTMANSISVAVASDQTVLPAGGNVAHDAVDAGNPIKLGHRAIAHGTNPTAVAAADRTDWLANRAGIPWVIGGHPNVVTIRANFTAAATDTALVTIGAGLKIVVTRVLVTAHNANTVNVSVVIGFGTVNTPTTTGVVAAHPGMPAGGGFNSGDGSGILGVGADNEDLRITSSVPTTGSIDVTISYYTIES